MNMSIRSIVTAVTFALAATSAFSQAATDKAEAEVRRIDRDANKVTLKHGPIKNLDMPPMTMVFQVRDPALLNQIAVGDRVLFTAEKQQGAYVVTTVEKAK